MKPLSQALLDRKRAKFTEQVRAAAVRWMADDPFQAFVHKPTFANAVEMVVQARFGPRDPLSCAGNLFAFEYMLDELDNAVASSLSLRLEGRFKLMDPDGNAIRICTAQSEPWANLVFVLDIDKNIHDHWTRMGVEDFRLMSADGVFNYAAEREAGAFGFTVAADVLVPVQEVPGRIDSTSSPEQPGFVPKFHPDPVKANAKCTIYWMTVGPMDRLLTPEERAKHNVETFSRRTPSGGTTIVRAHERRNPRTLRDRIENFDEVAHVVYRVYDADGVLRYIGEGKTTRPEHVNSGTSHNFKLNEHFFRRGPMRIELVARGLSKDEGLSIERLLIRGHRGPAELWNTRDYEPLSSS